MAPVRWIPVLLLLAILAGCQAPLPTHLTAFDALDAALREAPELRPVYAQATAVAGQPVGTAPLWRVGLQAADGHAHEAQVYAAGARQDLGFGAYKQHPDGAVILRDLGPSTPAPVLTTRGALDSNEMGPATAYWLDGESGGRWRLQNAAGGASWFNSVGTAMAAPAPAPTAWEALAALQTSGLVPPDPALTSVHGRETRGGFLPPAAQQQALLLPPDDPFDGRASFWRFTWQLSEPSGGHAGAIWADGRALAGWSYDDAPLATPRQLLDSDEAVSLMDPAHKPWATYDLGGGQQPRWSAQWLTGDVLDGPSVAATRYAVLTVSGHVFEKGPGGRPVCDQLPPHLRVEPVFERVTFWEGGPDRFPAGSRFAAWEQWRVVEENPTGCGIVERFTGSNSTLRMGWPGTGGRFTATWDGRLMVDGVPMEPGHVRGVQVNDQQTHETTDGPQTYTYSGTLTLTHLGWWPTAGVTQQPDPLD